MFFTLTWDTSQLRKQNLASNKARLQMDVFKSLNVLVAYVRVIIKYLWSQESNIYDSIFPSTDEASRERWKWLKCFACFTTNNNLFCGEDIFHASSTLMSACHVFYEGLGPQFWVITNVGSDSRLVNIVLKAGLQHSTAGNVSKSQFCGIKAGQPLTNVLSSMWRRSASSNTVITLMILSQPSLIRQFKHFKRNHRRPQSSSAGWNLKTWVTTECFKFKLKMLYFKN